MTYLEEQNITHGELAARNILVGQNLICKVANFEMTRVIEDDIYEAMMEETRGSDALKWTASEYGRFTIKSDVWSFGIVLHKIITCGCFPYPGMTDKQVLEQLRQGYRMPCPASCQDKLYDIMLDCWQEAPTNRPTFKKLQRQLEEFFITDDMHGCCDPEQN